MRVGPRMLDVIGRLLIGWSVLWLLIGVFVFSANSVVSPGNFLSDEAGIGVEVIGYVWAASIVIALVVALWDGLLRRAGGRWTAILCLTVYALGLLTTVLDPDPNDSLGELAGTGAFTIGAGILGGLLRVWGSSTVRPAEAS